jgi:protein kinase X
MSVDWWALGILLFEMVAGYPCFFADNPFALYQKILDAKVVFPAGISVPIATQSIIKSFLEKNRIRRLGCGRGGFMQIKAHKFFQGIDWISASKELMMPPIIPTVISPGDTSNYDFYPEEMAEEPSNLTKEQREHFQEFDRILERPVSTV